MTGKNGTIEPPKFNIVTIENSNYKFSASFFKLLFSLSKINLVFEDR